MRKQPSRGVLKRAWLPLKHPQTSRNKYPVRRCISPLFITGFYLIKCDPLKKWESLKKAFTKNPTLSVEQDLKGIPLNGLDFTIRNGFHWKESLLAKGMTSTKQNGFH